MHVAPTGVKYRVFGLDNRIGSNELEHEKKQALERQSRYAEHGLPQGCHRENGVLWRPGAIRIARKGAAPPLPGHHQRWAENGVRQQELAAPFEREREYQ